MIQTGVGPSPGGLFKLVDAFTAKKQCFVWNVLERGRQPKGETSDEKSK